MALTTGCDLYGCIRRFLCYRMFCWEVLIEGVGWEKRQCRGVEEKGDDQEYRNGELCYLLDLNDQIMNTGQNKHIRFLFLYSVTHMQRK